MPKYKIEWEHENKLHRVTLELNEIAEIVSDEVIREIDTPKKDTPKKDTPPTEKKECSTCAEKGLKRLIFGGAKLLKSELGIDAATDDEMSKRRSLCESCPKMDFGVCTDCGCFLAAKVKLKSEKCPEGKW